MDQGLLTKEASHELVDVIFAGVNYGRVYENTHYSHLGTRAPHPPIDSLFYPFSNP